MSEHSHQRADLTKNQSLVYDALCSSQGPLSAYTILDRLRDEGLRAPLQVYRALEKLVASGMVHRLESLNAFVACRRPDCASHSSVAFTICEKCGTVSELASESLAHYLTSVASEAQFAVQRSVVELRGTCGHCRPVQASTGLSQPAGPRKSWA